MFLTFLICCAVAGLCFKIMFYWENKSIKRRAGSIEEMIQEELNKNNFIVGNSIWWNYLYIATNTQNDKIIFIQYFFNTLSIYRQNKGLACEKLF